MPGARDEDESPGPGAAAVSAESSADRAASSPRLSDAPAGGPGLEDGGSPGRRRHQQRPKGRQRRRRRARRRRGGWWPWPWPWRRRQEPQLEGRLRRVSSPRPRAGSPGQVASCEQGAEGAAPSPPPPPLRARGSRRRRRLRAVELENLVANSLLLKARQGGCARRAPDLRGARTHAPLGLALGTGGSEASAVLHPFQQLGPQVKVACAVRSLVRACCRDLPPPRDVPCVSARRAGS